MTEDELVGWHHWLNGHEFDQTPLGDSEGQRRLVFCSPQSHKESDTTEQLNNNNTPAQTFSLIFVISWASQVVLVVMNPPAKAGET